MVAIGRGLVSNVQGMLLEVLAIAEESGFKPAGQSALDVCAGLSAARGEWQRAARFYGAAEAQINETGLHRDPADEAFLMPHVGKARDVLGAAAFSAAENTGGNLTYEAALVEARNWLNEIN